MRTRLSDPVRTLDGKITTIAELADQGRITFECSPNFKGPRGAMRKAYFATMPDGGCWEISAYAYKSRQSASAA